MAMSSGCGGVGARAPWAGLWTGEASLESNLALPSQTNYVSMLGLNNSHPGCLVEEILTQVPKDICTWILMPVLFVGEELEVPIHF